MKDIVKFWLPVAAIVFSVVSFSLSFWQTLQGAQSSIRPVLVFVWEDTGWHISNVGSGAALDVVVAQSDNTTDWTKPVRLPPLGVGRAVPLRWLGKCNVRALGVTYRDFEGRKYTTKTWDDKERLSLDHALRQWDPKTIKLWWELASAKRCDGV